MKIVVFFMLFLAVALSVFVVITGSGEPTTGLVIAVESPYTFAEREAAMFPDGPHWILRGFRGQDPISLTTLLAVVLFSCLCTVQALRALIGKRGLHHMPLVSAASILPIWIGACLTFAMLRLLPHYTGEPSYHHDLLGKIRVTLFTCLVGGLVPATIAAAAQIRHSVAHGLSPLNNS